MSVSVINEQSHCTIVLGQINKFREKKELYHDFLDS